MEDMVTSAGITLEQVHHGDGIACWAVNQRGLDRGHGIRTGLEDVPLLPDGRQARDNAELVAAALLGSVLRPLPKLIHAVFYFCGCGRRPGLS